MITLDDLTLILERVIKILRRRYGETYIEGIKIRRGRYEVFIVISENRGKIVISKGNLKVRVYTGLKGQEIAIRRILTREIDKYLRMKKYD